MFENINGDWLPFIVLFPLVGAIANGLFGKDANRRLVGFTAVASVVASFIFALLLFIKLTVLKHDAPDGDAALSVSLWEWFSISVQRGGSYVPVPVEIRFVFDSLSGLMTLVVTGIGSLIHIYSLGYMSEEKSYARFFTYLNLFTASMLILVLGSSFPVLFVGWEGVGLCSYLLIGFWYENKEYAAAGRKAFVVNRIGDFGVLIGMFILVGATGSFEFEAINAQADNLGGEFALGPFTLGATATVACLFLFLGCTGKSAQIPLFVWLPDAMAGPTPVSALIHAATMVTAGVYLCCRLSPVFLQSPTALAVIAIVGTATALIAACVAVVQKEMKRILAYSTVSQLGFMFAAVGVGAFSAGFFHVFTHAFFKACLFLGAGSVMHAVHAHGDANIFKLGGLKKIMPVTRITFLVSCWAIAGLPPFAGFFSKDEILLGATTIAMNETPLMAWTGWVVLIGLFLAATMTAFYMMRLYYFTFTGEYRSAGGHDEHGDDHDDHGEHGYSATPHESELSMTFPLMVLGLGAVLVGLLGLPHAFHLPNWWGHWMDASISHLGGFGPSDEVTNMTPVYVAMGFGLAAALIGVGVAHASFHNKAEDTLTTKLPKKFYDLLMDKWRIDELYAFLIVRPLRAISVFGGRIDKTFVDGIITGATSNGVKLMSWLSTRIQVGVVHAYGTAMVAGFALVAWWFVYPHADLRAEAEGESATFVAGRGLGYEYRWDFDSDGQYDAPVQPAELRIDVRDDISDAQMAGLVTAVRDAAQPTVDLPRDRSALGHAYDRGHKVYVMAPPVEEITDIITALERTGLVESIEIQPVGEAFSQMVTGNYRYQAEDVVGYHLIVGSAPNSARGNQSVAISERGIVLEDTLIGRAQHNQEGTRPAMQITEEGIRVLPNAGQAVFRNEPQLEPFVMQAGETAIINGVAVRIAPVVEATLQVRNSFGNLDTDTIEIVLDRVSQDAVVAELNTEAGR